MGMEPSGRELLVVVVKGTFRIPAIRRAARARRRAAAAGRWPIPSPANRVSPRRSTRPTFRRYKPRCDVLLNGSAYAPGGRPTRKVAVTLGVGPWSKTFNVVGRRAWEAGITGISAGRAAPFDVMPISYDGAFGGLDNFHDDPEKHTAYMANPVGSRIPQAAGQGAGRRHAAAGHRRARARPSASPMATTDRWPSGRSGAAGRSGCSMPVPTTMTGSTKPFPSCRPTFIRRTTRPRRPTSSCRT